MKEAIMIATLKQVKLFFGYPALAQFKEEWDQLSEAEQEELKALIGQELERVAVASA